MTKMSMLQAGRPSEKRAAATLASLSDKEEMARVNFALSRDEHRRLKVYAAEQGVTITDLFRRHIDELLAQARK